MSETHAVVLLLTVELLIPCAHSLKEKRRAVKGLKERLRSRFNASVAEVAYQDKWQRAGLAAALVGNERSQLESDAARIRQLCEEAPDLQVVLVQQEWL